MRSLILFDEYTAYTIEKKEQLPMKLFFFSCLCLCFYKLREDFRVLHCNLGENLAVELNLALLEFTHQLGVGRTVHASCGVDAHLLQATIVALFELATNVGVFAGFGCRCFCKRDF